MYSVEQISGRIEEVIRQTLQLGDDVVLKPESDLVTEIGLDSIEAFEAVATLHELLGARIPEDLDPKSIASIKSIADYILARSTAEQVGMFMSMDIAARLAELQDDGALT